MIKGFSLVSLFSDAIANAEGNPLGEGMKSPMTLVSSVNKGYALASIV